MNRKKKVKETRINEKNKKRLLTKIKRKYKTTQRRKKENRKTK